MRSQIPKAARAHNGARNSGPRASHDSRRRPLRVRALRAPSGRSACFEPGPARTNPSRCGATGSSLSRRGQRVYGTASAGAAQATVCKPTRARVAEGQAPPGVRAACSGGRPGHGRVVSEQVRHDSVLTVAFKFQAHHLLHIFKFVRDFGLGETCQVFRSFRDARLGRRVVGGASRSRAAPRAATVHTESAPSARHGESARRSGIRTASAARQGALLGLAPVFAGRARAWAGMGSDSREAPRDSEGALS